METILPILFAAMVTAFFLHRHVRELKQREERARASAAKGQLFTEGPKGLHPSIDIRKCIGCGGCTEVCPEGDVLAMLGGQVAIVNGHKCIGHGLCAEACPVGAITLVMAEPSMGADLPRLTAQYETNIKNLFIAGELGGLALIKNAVNQGRECIDVIAQRIGQKPAHGMDHNVYDVLIVGAGPAGISASLRAIEKGLRYITLEKDEVGGTVAKYPRQKLVMTSPVQFPMYGKFKQLQMSKESLLAFWDVILNRSDFNVSTGESVTDIQRGADGIFTIRANATYRARAVVLALGRAGEPRKLGVPGEELPKVMYRLIEADHYTGKRILVVGGGDSAVEAAMGLAHQKGNLVTLSYRQSTFTRLKERNARRIAESMQSGKVEVIFDSTPIEFREDKVILKMGEALREVPNDYVWIFAGGVPPRDFLSKIGIQMGMKDITREASRESRMAESARQQPVGV